MNASDIIDGRYRLERLLGRGGMAEVWLAEDQRLGRWVAVKALRDSGDEDAFVDLEREARVIARLQHPNIVAVYDAGVHEGRHYLVMEYIHGYSLRQLLQTRGRFTEQETVLYGKQIASALAYAHGQGVIHCDIKPENILIDEHGTAKVTDFGVAETVTRTLAPQQARELLGTIAYLAPEVLLGAEATEAADVYSLSLTLFEMAAGRLPFTGTTAAAVAGQRVAGPAPRLRDFVASASPELEATLAQGLAQLPVARFGAVAELVGALNNVPQRASTVPQGVVTPPGRPPRLPSRAPHATRRVRQAPPARSQGSPGVIVAIVCAVALALGAGVAGAFLFARSGDDVQPTPTPTAPPSTPTPPVRTPTPRPTDEPTLTPTPTRSPSPSPSPSPTPSRTPGSPSPSPSASASPSSSPSPSASATPRPSPSPAPTP